MVFHANGAFAWKPKLTTMSEELRRRLLHMDREHTEAEKDDIVDDFLLKMCDSGYNHSARKEIIVSAVKKYYRQILEEETGGRKVYRSSDEMAETRKLKALNNLTWFKGKRGGRNVTPLKDLPFYNQKESLKNPGNGARKQEKRNKREGEGEGNANRGQETQ